MEPKGSLESINIFLILSNTTVLYSKIPYKKALNLLHAKRNIPNAHLHKKHLSMLEISSYFKTTQACKIDQDRYDQDQRSTRRYRPASTICGHIAEPFPELGGLDEISRFWINLIYPVF